MAERRVHRAASSPALATGEKKSKNDRGGGGASRLRPRKEIKNGREGWSAERPGKNKSYRSSNYQTAPSTYGLAYWDLRGGQAEKGGEDLSMKGLSVSSLLSTLGKEKKVQTRIAKRTLNSDSAERGRGIPRPRGKNYGKWGECKKYLKRRVSVTTRAQKL